MNQIQILDNLQKIYNNINISSDKEIILSDNQIYILSTKYIGTRKAERVHIIFNCGCEAAYFGTSEAERVHTYLQKIENIN